MQETYSDSSSEKQKHSIGDILKKGFFFEGICTLKRYWIHCLISILITLIIVFADYLYVNLHKHTSNGLNLAKTIVCMIVLMTWNIHMMCLSVQRIRSIGLNPWKILIPVYNAVNVLFVPANKDQTHNKYINCKIPNAVLFRIILITLTVLFSGVQLEAVAGFSQIFSRNDVLNEKYKLEESSSENDRFSDSLYDFANDDSIINEPYLNCFFCSDNDDFINFLVKHNYTKENAEDLVSYIEKRAEKTSFRDPKTTNYMIDNNLKFAFPTDINNDWMGKIYINREGNISSFPPIVFSKGFIMGEGVQTYTKTTYFYISRREFIDYCVYSGMTSDKAIEFERNLYNAKIDSQLIFEDSTLPDEIKNTMVKMNYDYSVLTSNNGIWSGFINIKHGEKIYTFHCSNITYFTDYFNLNNAPIYLIENDCSLNYFLYDDNWEIFRFIFFGPENPISIRKKIYNPVENYDYELNMVLSENVKNEMINGNYSFSEPYDPTTGSWFGVRNMLRDNNFYIYKIQ